MSNSEKIQRVINTLGHITIPGSYDNAGYLLAMYQLLGEVRDELKAQEDEQDAGNADA